MRLFQRSLVFLTGLFALTLAGCGSGGAANTGTAQVRCSGGESFCLVSCDLGCGGLGCAVTEVAENQRLQFVFSQAVQSDSVNGGSFSLRTVNGEAPDGNVIVDGKTVTFVPSINVTGGVSTFGFRRNESYVVTVSNGLRGIRSTSGAVLSRSSSCTFSAVRGIIDEDNAPPSATLAAPTNLTSAPSDSTIVVRFSEIVDTTPFLTPISASTPIHYVLRQTRIPAGGNERVCNLDSEAIQIDGVPVIGNEQVNGRLVSTISLRPTIALPGLSCVEVQVTSDVRDLAGKGAREATFRFLTAASAVTELPIVEDFVSDNRKDLVVSGGRWQLGAHAALVGGDGRHGSFHPENGVGSGNLFEWSTDTSITIPGSQTLNGQDQVVSNGEFFFSDLVVPANMTVKFKGTNPVRLHVRGRVEINGRILASGEPITVANFRNVATATDAPLAGQLGSLPGPGGGRGGKGGDRCLQAGGPQPAFNGANGQDLNVPAGHAYLAQVSGTGGRGSPLYPSNGLTSGLPLTQVINTLYSRVCGFGGGGGGYMVAGGQGTGASGSEALILPAAPIAGGALFPLLPPPSPAPSSAVHYLVGGSGGGGGGSHPFLGALTAANIPQFANDVWKAGAGGTGGGGAVLVRAGGNLVVPATGSIEVKGGAGVLLDGDNPATGTVEVTSATGSFGVPQPGGGGSGGSVVVQVDGDVLVDGRLDASGGAGSHMDTFTVTSAVPVRTASTRGGNGANGNYRVEARGSISVTNVNNVPVFSGAVNSGTLNDRDSVSGSRSLWRSSGLVFPPSWVRYELQVDTDGDGVVDRLYSDDSSVSGSIGPANDPLGPVRVLFQGARVNAANEPDVATIRPWREFVNDSVGQGINGDAATGFRFELLFNNDLFPNAVVRRLTVIVRG